MRERQILWLRLRDHLEDPHGFDGDRLEQLPLDKLWRRHLRQHARRRTHWHPRRLYLELPATSGGGASASERLSSPPVTGSGAAIELEPALF